jgi:AraC family transcriptional activator FtrA
MTGPMLSLSGSTAVNRDVAVLVYEGLGTFEFGICAEIFGLPRPEMGDDWYRFSICALKAGPLPTNSGLVVQVDRGLEGFDTAGTIVIPGWKGAEVPVPEELIARLVRAHARGARLISLCSGAFVLAATGLLDGRRATTHWRYADLLAASYGRIAVDPSVLYVDEGDVLTSAGSAAAVDLLLHVVRKDFGPNAANRVARRLVMPPHRDGGQAQFIERPVPARPEGRLASLLDAMRRRLDHPHSIAELAAASAMSRRTFLRRFREMTGLTPGRWLAQARVDAAKALLEEGRLPVAEIAFRAGFGSAEALRHHFRREVGLSPRDYRDRFAHDPQPIGANGARNLPSAPIAAGA